MVLRDFRDEYLMPNPAGRTFVKIYYDVNPPLADVIMDNERLRTNVRAGFVKPLVYISRRFMCVRLSIYGPQNQKKRKNIQKVFCGHRLTQINAD